MDKKTVAFNPNLEVIGIDEYIQRRGALVSLQSTGALTLPPHGLGRLSIRKSFVSHNEHYSNKTPKNWDQAIKASKKIGAFKTKRSRKPSAWRAFSEVSVAGISATMDQRSPLLRRILWGSVLVICTALMFVQCLNRVLYYMEEPVNVNVRITYNDTLEYPAVTLCNKNMFNKTAIMELMIENKVIPQDSPNVEANLSLLVGVNGFTPSQLWSLVAHKRHIFVAECWFGRGMKCDDTGTWLQVHTVLGPCYTYMFNNTHVSAVGTFHNLYLRLQETTPILHKDETGVRILVHERRESPELTSRTRGMSAELGWSREVKLELRKFHILDTEKNPCREDPKYLSSTCELGCFQQFMYKVTKCRMPFMYGPAFDNVTDCILPDSYEAAMSAVNSMLLSGGWSVGNCTCPRECYQTAFNTYPENMVFKHNEIKLRIFYEYRADPESGGNMNFVFGRLGGHYMGTLISPADEQLGEGINNEMGDVFVMSKQSLVFEQITEEPAYPMISLLCDIGGTLGLLMGASVLTVCELIEVAWSHFIRRFCLLEERRKPSATNQTSPMSENLAEYKTTY